MRVWGIKEGGLASQGLLWHSEGGLEYADSKGNGEKQMASKFKHKQNVKHFIREHFKHLQKQRE